MRRSDRGEHDQVPDVTPRDAAVILAVPENASKADVDRAFKSRARLVHPDRYPDGSIEHTEATVEFQRIVAARTALLSAIESVGVPEDAEQHSSGAPEEPEEPSPRQETHATAVGNVDFPLVEAVQEAMDIAARMTKRARNLRIAFWCCAALLYGSAFWGVEADENAWSEALRVTFTLSALGAFVGMVRLGRHRRQALNAVASAVSVIREIVPSTQYLAEAMVLDRHGVHAPLRFAEAFDRDAG